MKPVIGAEYSIGIRLYIITEITLANMLPDFMLLRVEKVYTSKP